VTSRDMTQKSRVKSQGCKVTHGLQGKICYN